MPKCLPRCPGQASLGHVGVGRGALRPEEEPSGVQARKPDVFDVALKVPEVFLEGLSPVVKK